MELKDYEKRVRDIRPELVIERVSLKKEGLLNDVVIVNDELVFRFAKREFGYKDLQEEANVLRFLKNYITLPIPSPFHQSPDAMAYQLIPGVTLRRDNLLRLRADDQQSIADQLAQFFKELHSVPIEASDFRSRWPTR